jgi:DNA-directed RNA polymerase specialized sigma24 family protein
MKKASELPGTGTDWSQSDWKRFASIARRILAKAGISREEIEDLTQDCLLALLKNAEAVRDPTRFLRVVASRRLSQHFRARYTRRVPADLVPRWCSGEPVGPGGGCMPQ